MSGWNSRQMEWLLWQMQSPEEQAEQLKRQAEQHAGLMQLINEQFAVVINGPSAGEIVCASSGKRAGRARINALAVKEGRTSFAARWLADPDRRELTDIALRRIIASAGKPRASRDARL